jgi:hypothetical protein
MSTTRRRKHRAAGTARRAHARAHAKAGLTAVASVATVVTVVLTVAGSVLAPSGASGTRMPRHQTRTVTATTTVTATETVTVPGPTSTATVTATVPGPTATVTVPGPTTTATGAETPIVSAPTLTATPSTSAPTSPTSAPDIRTLTDFAQQSAGLFLGSGQLLGSGVDRTIYRPAPHTSAKRAPSAGTNQLKLIRAGGLSSRTAAAVDLGGFTLEGTDQSPTLEAYGGIVVGYGTGSRVHDVKVTGIPGYDSRPPGETFSLAMFHAASSHLSDVTLDGNRTSDGEQVAATLLGYNYTTGTNTITNLKANHAGYGFGLAMFQTAGTYTFNGRCDLSHNRKAINIEQSIGGSVYNFDGCDFRGTTGAPYVAQVTSINSSSQVYFHDPVVDSWPLKVNCYSPAALSGANKQLDSDIHLIINGVDVSHDPTKLQITHQ